MKKTLLIAVSIALVCVLALGGTIAYLQDTDSDVNVMTMGNVSIVQNEYERVVNSDGNYNTIKVDDVDSYELQGFTQGKPLLPIVGDPSEPGDSPAYAGWDTTPVRMSQVGSYGGMDVFAGKNAQDKFVVVENDGLTDAYVRTVVAFEAGSLTLDEWEDIIGYSFHFTWGAELYDNIVEIDGNKYAVVEFVYCGYEDDTTERHANGILPAGDTAYPSLSQVYMSHEATNEDVKAIDGNGNNAYDILVISQAVQADGFVGATAALDAAFGEKNDDNIKSWFATMPSGYEVSNFNELAGVAKVGGDVTVTEDVIGDGLTVSAGKDLDIDLDSNMLSAPVVNYGDLEISGGTMNSASAGIENLGDAVLTDIEMTAGSPYDYSNISRSGAETVYNNVDIVSGGGGVAAADGAKVIFNSGSVAVNSASTSGRYIFYTEGAGSTITINDGTFSFSSTLNQKRAYIYAGAGTTVYVNGGTFGKASSRSGYTAGILGEGEVIIKGGTFGFNPSAWVADGYEAVKNGTVWVVSAK